MLDRDGGLVRGTLDLLILKALTWGPRHGYAIAEWVRAITGGDIHDLDARFPFGRVSTPDDVAAAVLWFVSDANPYCSGQKLNIDGAGQARF